MTLRPLLSRDFTAVIRRYGSDLAVSCLLFAGASMAAGRVWRFAFDDEVYTLGVTERLSFLRLVTVYPAGSDVHPPLSYMLFWLLHDIGLSEAGLRLCSLAMTASALAMLHGLALMLIVRRHGEVPAATRVMAIVLFGLCALAVGQGDAIRWYPLFAMLVAASVTLYVAAGNDTAKLCAAVPLGLAASTNFLAAPVIGAFAIYRYALQRQFRMPVDAALWAVTALFGALAVYSGGSALAHRASISAHFFGGSVGAVFTDLLGFFGGDALGPSQAWMVVPAVIIAAMAILAAVDRREPSHPVHLFLLLLAGAALMALSGFARPRSFLYLAPVLAALLTLYLDSLVRRAPAAAIVLSGLLLMTSAAAIANINGGTHPFKRNAAIPYRSIVEFIDGNAAGSALIVSTDPVIAWVLRHRPDASGSCASYFVSERGCFAAGRSYDSIFVISGHSDKSEQSVVQRAFTAAVDQATAGRQKRATMSAGIDDDAALKTRLTGVALDKAILKIEFYR